MCGACVRSPTSCQLNCNTMPRPSHYFHDFKTTMLLITNNTQHATRTICTQTPANSVRLWSHTLARNTPRIARIVRLCQSVHSGPTLSLLVRGAVGPKTTVLPNCIQDVNDLAHKNLCHPIAHKTSSFSPLNALYL